MSNLVKNILIALGITILLILIYFLFLKGQNFNMKDDANFIRTTEEVSLQIERILSDTQKINSYDIDENSKILTDIRFTSLIDMNVTIPEVDTGRENPFAPVVQ